MSRIVGPASGHAALTGTSGNDLILAYGDANTITGGGGNDTIEAESGNGNDIMVGAAMDGLTALTDIIRLDGTGDTVTGGDENVKLVGDISGSNVNLGFGDNSITAAGSGNTIALGAGSNSVKTTGGNDTVSFSGQAPSAFSDNVTVTGSHDDVDNSLSFLASGASGVLDVTGGSGSGTFLLGSSGGTIVTHGVDNLIQGGALGTKIQAGSGHDTVSLTGGTHGSGGEADILLGGTHNLVTGSVQDVSVTGGAGYDTLDFGQPAGSTSIQVTDAGVHDSVSVFGAAATIDGGGSYETVSAISSVATMTFSGTSDVLNLSGAQGAAGVPSAYVNDLSTGLHVNLGEYAGQSYPSNGNLTINGFDSTGLIDFQDGRGGFTSTAQIAGDLHEYAPDDYTLALPDGSGTITFLNAGHLTASNFKLG